MDDIKYTTVYKWYAPLEVWVELNEEFKFTLDPFKDYDTTDEEILLSKTWNRKERVFCCPPLWQKYSSVGRKMLPAWKGWRYCSYVVAGKDRHSMVPQFCI